MMTRLLAKVTAWVIFSTIVILLAYDTVAVLLGGSNATLSWVTWTCAHKYPMIPFMSGMLCGHLFFSQHEGENR